MIPTTFFVRSDVVVIASDPEMADISNPNGDIYGYASYLVAEEADGTRYAHSSHWKDHTEAFSSAPADRFRLAVENVLRVKPDYEFDMNQWTLIEPRYGSAAYEAYEAAHPSEGYSTADDFDLF